MAICSMSILVNMSLYQTLRLETGNIRVLGLVCVLIIDIHGVHIVCALNNNMYYEHPCILIHLH